MTGADFRELNRFSNAFVFEKSYLDYANFAGIKFRKILFTDCIIQEANFDEADLVSSVFDKCDLLRSTFYGTDLEKVDFSTSFNYSINPSMCKLKKTIFSEAELRGLVNHLNIEIK